jgi:hypothetical protein
MVIKMDKHDSEILANESYYLRKLKELKNKLPQMSAEDLVDELEEAYTTYGEYIRRDDAVCWSAKAEEYVTSIYYTIRAEIIQRLDGEDDGSDDTEEYEEEN